MDDANQKAQDEAQKQHGELVQKLQEAREKGAEALEASHWTDTKQTTKEHLGKLHTEENKPDEMEADKVGKPQIGNLTKVNQNEGETTVDVVQVPEGAEETGVGLPAGGGFTPPTEGDRVGRLLDEELGLKEKAAERQAEHEEKSTGGGKKGKKKKSEENF